MKLSFNTNPSGITPAIKLLKRALFQMSYDTELRERLGLSTKDVLAAEQFKADLTLAYVTAETRKKDLEISKIP